jgi:hypothetical protein
MNFKILKLAFHFILVLLLFSCEKSAKPLYDVKLEADFDLTNISAGSNLVRNFVVIRDIPVFYKQNADQRGVDTSNIVIAYPSFGLIKSRFGSEDMSFVQDVIVNIIRPGRLPLEIYRLDFVQLNTGNDIRMLSGTFPGLKQELAKEKIDIEIGFRFRRQPPINFRGRIEFGYAVFEEE